MWDAVCAEVDASGATWKAKYYPEGEGGAHETIGVAALEVCVGVCVYVCACVCALEFSPFIRSHMRVHVFHKDILFKHCMNAV
jgi:hypothetical protein